LDAFLRVKSLIGQQERTSKGSAMNKTSAGGPGPAWNQGLEHFWKLRCSDCAVLNQHIQPHTRPFPSALNYKAWHSENAMPAATGTCFLCHFQSSLHMAILHMSFSLTRVKHTFSLIFDHSIGRAIIHSSANSKESSKQIHFWRPTRTPHKMVTPITSSDRNRIEHKQAINSWAMIHYKIEDHENHQCIIIHRSPIHTNIYNYMYTYSFTSSTAQGGGGSFKNRKPIGEVRCCESGMAERSHSWIERWLSVSAYLSIDRSIYLSVCLSIYLSTYLSIYLSICLLWYFMCFAPPQRALFHLSSGQLAPHPPL